MDEGRTPSSAQVGHGDGNGAPRATASGEDIAGGSSKTLTRKQKRAMKFGGATLPGGKAGEQPLERGAEGIVDAILGASSSSIINQGELPVTKGSREEVAVSDDGAARPQNQSTLVGESIDESTVDRAERASSSGVQKKSKKKSKKAEKRNKNEDEAGTSLRQSETGEQKVKSRMKEKDRSQETLDGATSTSNSSRGHEFPLPLSVNREGRGSAVQYEKRRRFKDHMSAFELSTGVKSGQYFKGVFRVNSHNRTEAYVTVEGIPTDVLIDGLQAQNRAVEGDTVAICMHQSDKWTKMRSGSASSDNDSSKKAPMDVQLGSWLEDMGVGSSSEYEEEGESAPCGLASHSDGSRSAAEGTEPGGSRPGAGSGLGSSRRGGGNDALVDQLATETRGMSLGDGGGAGSSREVSAEDAADMEVEGEGPEVVKRKIQAWAAVVRAWPRKRPTAEVVGILERSPRRERVVGYLEIEDVKAKEEVRGPTSSEDEGRGSAPAGPRRLPSDSRANQAVALVPSDPRFPKMLVFVSGLPDGVKKRLLEQDPTLSQCLLAARMDMWSATSVMPLAVVRESLGQAGEIETESAAIMFEHNIHGVDFPEKALACLPKTPWTIPKTELALRRDFRSATRVFSIDPPTARDLDDALSVQPLPNGNLHVGVHIADVSYFIHPGSELDLEARRRSTSVYLIQRVLPMLPPLLCEELCSLNPGVDRLTFSVLWEMTPQGEIVDRWLGRSVISSCCKLAYGHAQAMIEGGAADCSGLPKLHGSYTWDEVAGDVRLLNSLAVQLRQKRFAGGALRLDNLKLQFALDEDGNPCDVGLESRMDSNFLVEEFMLLANMTVASVISSAFPTAALLRRHPRPNSRKMSDCADFCTATGLAFDSSSSAAIHGSLQAARAAVDRGELDPAFLDILMVNVSRPMQLAKYFCTGEFPDAEHEWAHYALATPLYTHFTSPIRRYADVVVHRLLATALHAEETILGQTAAALVPRPRGSIRGSKAGGNRQLASPRSPILLRLLQELRERGVSQARASPEAFLALLKYFSGLRGGESMGAEAMEEARAVAETSAKLCGLLKEEELTEVAKHCNERKLASKSAQEASNKIYLCVLLRKRRGIVSDARVVALGPKFMSIYVVKFGLERRIYFDNIDGVVAEWFETTHTLVLSLSENEAEGRGKATPQRGGASGGGGGRGGGRGRYGGRRGGSKALEHLATVVDPTNSLLVEDNNLLSMGTGVGPPPEGGASDRLGKGGEGMTGTGKAKRVVRPLGGPSILGEDGVEATIFPLALRLLSSVPVMVHAVGGGKEPLDIGVRLYISAYEVLVGEEENVVVD